MVHALRPLLAGNWKMNGLGAAVNEARKVAEALGADAPPADVMICPPSTLIARLADTAKGSPLQVGAQDCHTAVAGAHTGDVSAEMLKDAGATAVILGHSERRADHGETSALVRAKVEAAARAGLMAIVCVGETAGERAAGLTLTVVGRQLTQSLPDKLGEAGVVIAYEPVWAIGTGLVASPDDIVAVHADMRRALVARYGAAGAAMRLLYGGSVKPDNASTLLKLPEVNGALVGGASLKSGDFLGILAAYR